MGAGPRRRRQQLRPLPPEVRALPQVGGLLDPDVERILALKPDLVIVYATQKDRSSSSSRAGIPISTTSTGLADIMTTIRALGVRIGSAARADALASGIDARLAAIAPGRRRPPPPANAAGVRARPGTLRGVYASGGYGFLHDMLRPPAETNVFADVRQQAVQASTEMIIASSPT